MRDRILVESFIVKNDRILAVSWVRMLITVELGILGHVNTRVTADVHSLLLQNGSQRGVAACLAGMKVIERLLFQLGVNRIEVAINVILLKVAAGEFDHGESSSRDAGRSSTAKPSSCTRSMNVGALIELV